MTVAGGSAQDFSRVSWLTDREKAILQREGFLQGSAPDLGRLPLLARHPQRALVVSVAEGSPRRSLNVVVEGVFWMPLQAVTPREAQERFFYLSQSFSRMKGMTYFSQSRNRRETLILDIYRVEGPDRTARLPDRPWSEVAPSSFEYFFQKDNTFGEAVYSMRVRNQFPQTTVVIANEQRIFWGLIPLVDPRNLQFIFQAEFLEDGILVYGLSGAQALSLFGLERSREASFFNRLRALADWFRGQFGA